MKMDKKTLVVVGGILSIAVGIFTKDPSTGELKDVATGNVVTDLTEVSIEGKYATIDGAKYKMYFDASSAVFQDGVIRVPRKAGSTVVETKDIELQVAANEIDATEKHLASTGKTGDKGQFWLNLKTRLDSLSVTLPSPSSGE